jgi:hypothetical protein
MMWAANRSWSFDAVMLRCNIQGTALTGKENHLLLPSKLIQTRLSISDSDGVNGQKNWKCQDGEHQKYP